ncbi:protachykinin-1-like isoform X1 [Ranitomeya imitator]|uniref:protachykinin-1-like isoform X1 n=1 Tax=Ranitomeya imitator TaxID=111125 RepID=UPI0037E8C111
MLLTRCRVCPSCGVCLCYRGCCVVTGATPDTLSPEMKKLTTRSEEDLEEPAYDRYPMRIARKFRPDQFYGIMGKRNSESKRASPKIQKADSFIGLMGKRSLSSESEDRNTEYESVRRRK